MQFLLLAGLAMLQLGAAAGVGGQQGVLHPEHIKKLHKEKRELELKEAKKRVAPPGRGDHNGEHPPGASGPTFSRPAHADMQEKGGAIHPTCPGAVAKLALSCCQRQ